MLTKNMDVFLHIPKCGGSTIRQYYARAYKHEILYIGRDHLPSERFRDHRDFSGVSAIVGHLTASDFFLNPYFGLFNGGLLSIHSVVRDPIDRIISNYNFILSNKKHHRHHQIKRIKPHDAVMRHTANSQFLFLGGGKLFDRPEDICAALNVVNLLDSIDYFFQYFKSRFDGFERPAKPANVTSSRFAESQDKFFSRTDLSAAQIQSLRKRHEMDFRLLELSSSPSSKD